MEGPPGDETLLAGVAERDIGAFRVLYERHAGWLALRCYTRSPSTTACHQQTRPTRQSPAPPGPKCSATPLDHFGPFRPEHQPAVATDASDFLRTRLDAVAHSLPGRK